VDRPVALQEHRAARVASDPAAARGVQRVQPGAVQQSERCVQHRQLRKDHVRAGWKGHPAGSEILVLTIVNSQLPTPNSQLPRTADWELEVGSWALEVGSWALEVGS